MEVFKEQEVSNTILAFAKMEYVDFAVLEARCSRL